MKAKNSGRLRIIGGKWKGFCWKFPVTESIRPTPNRIRETVFNWLIHEVKESICLDLFAGSGALGLEALSRGAKKVFFIDQSKEVIQNIEKYLQQWEAGQQAECYTLKVPCPLPMIKEKAQIVFLDPPFKKGYLPKICYWIEEQSWLAENALIYIETDFTLSVDILPLNWKIVKQKKAGMVHYHLLQIS